MIKTTEKTVTIRLTKTELWELMDNFNASYSSASTSSTGASFDDDNSLAERVSKKLAAAYKKVAA
jgi:hypothetical protein